MSIQKMKRVRLIGLRSEKDALLDDLLIKILGQYAVQNKDWKSTMKSLLYACRDNKRKVNHLFYSRFQQDLPYNNPTYPFRFLCISTWKSQNFRILDFSVGFWMFLHKCHLH